MRVVLDPEGLISVRLGHGQVKLGNMGASTTPNRRSADGEGECQLRAVEQPWLQVDLVLDVPRPSPAVAFAVMDEGCTGLCTPLECQMALHAAGPEHPLTFCMGHLR